MNLRLIRHLWGVDCSQGYSLHIDHWRKIGYEGIETSIRLVPDREEFLRTVREQNLLWIPQVFTCMARRDGSPTEHLRSLGEQVEECLDAHPLFVNAQSGSDAWSQHEAEDFYSAAVDWEKSAGIAIAHETHRSRYLGNPWNTRAILSALPDLKLTCDFSHWVCVAERLLEDCADIIAQAASHALHLHARVGYEEGPQVSDPRAPEWSQHLAAHEAWWDLIWQSQEQRRFAWSTLTPEFGPKPYMPVAPYSGEPMADLNEICDWIAVRQAQRFKLRDQAAVERPLNIR